MTSTMFLSAHSGLMTMKALSILIDLLVRNILHKGNCNMWCFVTGFFTYHVLKIHPYCSTYQYLSFFFNCPIIFYCIDIPHFDHSFNLMDIWVGSIFGF